MARNVDVAGTTYSIPTSGDQDWGSAFEDWAIGVSGAVTTSGAATRGTQFFDIRQPYPTYNAVGTATGGTTPGAVPGQANKAVTRACVQNILNTIYTGYVGDAGGAVVGASAVIYFPYDDEGWWFDQGLSYQGAPSYGLLLMGEAASPRGRREGTTLIYDGAAGGTFWDLVAINGSEIRNLKFDMGAKASKCIWARHKFLGGSQLAGSSGVDCYSVYFDNAPIDATYGPTSIMFAAGKDEGDGNTYQASEYRFFRCTFQGPGEGPQGWGFKALVAGNTKNFVFHNCVFNYLHMGAEAGSGYMEVVECNVGNMNSYPQTNGTFRPDSAAFYHYGNTLTVTGGGMENNYPSRFAYTGQGTNACMTGVYLAITPYVDDWATCFQGPSMVQACSWEHNYRAHNFQGAPAWAALTAYAVDDEVWNGNYAYRCVTAGTSAGAGGPTTTSSNITDGSAHWKYKGSRDGNLLDVGINSIGMTSGFGGVSILNNTFLASTTLDLNVHVTDANKNEYSTTYGQYNAVSLLIFGNATAVSGSTPNHQMNNVIGDFNMGADRLWTDDTDTGVTVNSNGNGVFKCTVPFGTFKGGTATTTVNIGGLLNGRRITSFVADVTSGFTCGAATLTLKAGTDDASAYDNDKLLVAFDPSSTTTKGTATADLGVGMASTPGNAYLSRLTGGYGGAAEKITLEMHCSSGNLNSLTTGSVTVYLRHERAIP